MELSKKEAIVLLDNPPTSSNAENFVLEGYKSKETSKKIPDLKDSVETWTTKMTLHAGRIQGDSSSHTLLFPDQLLCILFILRYAISDRNSLNDLKTLLSEDYRPEYQQFTTKEFYEPTWLRENLVVIVVDIVNTFMGNTSVLAATMSHPKNLKARMKMALLYTTTKAIIKVLLKYGCNPLLPTTEHFQDFITYLKERKNAGQPTTAVEVILQALPTLVKDTITNHFADSIRGVPAKEHAQGLKWHRTTKDANNNEVPWPFTVNSFNVSIVAGVFNGGSIERKRLGIFNFVDSFLQGEITFDQLPTEPIVYPTQTTSTETSSSNKKTTSSGARGSSNGSRRTKKTHPTLNTAGITTHLTSIKNATTTTPLTRSTNQTVKNAIATITSAVAGIETILQAYNTTNNQEAT